MTKTSETGRPALQLLGAGLPRTGTHSLKLALERLLGGSCYHMFEVVEEHPDHIPVWHRAVQGQLPDWDDLFAGYRSCVDWPVSAFWRELSNAYPDTVVLLSVRNDARTWWASIDRTVLEAARRPVPPGGSPFFAMLGGLLTRFCEQWSDPEAAMAAYERHNTEVRATISPRRLVEWRPSDGWEPICAALVLPVPDEPFPLSNTTSEFRARAGFDG